jgi:hypothetical protein
MCACVLGVFCVHVACACVCVHVFVFVCVCRGHLTNRNSISNENRKEGCFRELVCFQVCVPSRVISYLCGVCAFAGVLC